MTTDDHSADAGNMVQPPLSREQVLAVERSADWPLVTALRDTALYWMGVAERREQTDRMLREGYWRLKPGVSDGLEWELVTPPPENPPPNPPA
jgi:hypothetical protein